MKSSNLRLLRAIVYGSSKPCTQCQRRLFSKTSYIQNSAQPTGITGLPKADVAPKRQIAPRLLSKDFEAKPIGAPIGVRKPPQSSDLPEIAEFEALYADGKDVRNAQDRNTATRALLLKDMDRSHVRDYRNVAYGKDGGKFYLANPLIYKSGVSLYWPNLLGKTLARDHADTTSMLKGFVSVVSLFERQWGFRQTRSFIGKDENPDVHRLIEENSDVAQVLDINMEKIYGMKLVAKLFEWQLRKGKTEEEKDRYFMASDVPIVLKEALGLQNSSVGYVFLVDQDCKIRWSACADALPDEKESMLKGLRTLIKQAKKEVVSHPS